METGRDERHGAWAQKVTWRHDLEDFAFYIFLFLGTIGLVVFVYIFMGFWEVMLLFTWGLGQD